jgi:four helix bundle protein
MIKKDPLREKTFQLAIRIVNLHRYLVSQKKEYTISKQIVRSGTNPGAMVREAANAESGLDFIHKLANAQKETGETLYWLELLWKTGYLTEIEYKSIHDDTIEVMKLLRSSILTKKANISSKGTIVIFFICIFVYMLYKIN